MSSWPILNSNLWLSSTGVHQFDSLLLWESQREQHNKTDISQEVSIFTNEAKCLCFGCFLNFYISFFYSPQWPPVCGRALYLSLDSQCQRRETLTRFSTFPFDCRWVKYIGMHERENPPPEKVSFALDSFSPSPSPCYGWNCLKCDCECE